MNSLEDVIEQLGQIAGKFGVWIVLGLILLEVVVARRRGEL